MASLYTEANGTRRILFVDGSGKRRSVRLGDIPQRAAETFQRRIEALLANKLAGVANDSELAKWLGDLPDATHEKLVGVGLAEPRAAREVVTLGGLIERIWASSTVKPVTRLSYQQTFDSLVHHFGKQCNIEDITVSDADAWRKSLATADAAKFTLAKATQAKRVKVARALFAKAIAWKLLAVSPFAAMKVGSMANPERSVYVPVSTIERVLDECPDDAWRCVVSLVRFAGLRCPSEVALLRWCDVDWARGTLLARSPKTSGHEGHAQRFVPIAPRVRVILERLFEAAPVGAVRVIPESVCTTTSNLRTGLERVLTRANIQAWPRLFHNLRASCATDWAESLPAHSVAKWLGHSPQISAAHYLQTRDEHFEKVTGIAPVHTMGEPSVGSGARAANRHTKGGAESGARVVQNAVQSVAATQSHRLPSDSRTPAKQADWQLVAVGGDSWLNTANGPGGT